MRVSDEELGKYLTLVETCFPMSWRGPAVEKLILDLRDARAVLREVRDYFYMARVPHMGWVAKIDAVIGDSGSNSDGKR